MEKSADLFFIEGGHVSSSGNYKSLSLNILKMASSSSAINN